MINLAPYIDHTVLKPDAIEKDIISLCQEAIKHQFMAVCVNGCWTALAAQQLSGHPQKVASVIGFPLGAMSSAAKIAETKDALENGADEIDMVLNIGWLKAGQDRAVQEEIEAIKKLMGSKVLKVIIETCYLTDNQKKKACTLAVAAGADYVKTSTGFGSGGATFADVQLMKTVVGDKALIKASGGVRDRATALKYVDLGVSRIGTSSGIKLLTP